MNNHLKIILEGIPKTLKGYDIYTNATTQLVDQRRAIVANDWDKLELLANQGLSTALGAYREIRRNLGVLYTSLSEANENFVDMLKKHIKIKDKDTRKEFFSGMKEELIKLNPNIDKKYLNGIDEMIEGKIRGNSLLASLKETPSKSESTEMVQSAINATVALAVRSLMALTYCNFHSQFETNSNHDFSNYGDEFFEKLQSEVDIFNKQIEKSIKKLYSDILLGISPKTSAEALAGMIEESLPKFGRIQATIRLYTKYLYDAGKGTDSEKAGNLAAKANDITRTAYAAHASAYYLSLQSKAINQDTKAKHALNVDDLAYNTDFPNGKDTDISKVDQLKNGDYVEIAGFVRSIDVGKDSDGKLITQVTLYDPSSNSKVVAAGIYVHLIHIGLTEGSYCRLNGTWQSKSGLNKGNPAVEIEKLKINELSTSSWHILFMDIADKFVDRWPGGLNISYGLAPHKSGEKEGDSKILGAGELIYKPFIR